MDKEHIIPITNGKGSLALVDGTYNATAEITGYDSSTLDPTSIDIVDGTNEYSFTVSASGTLTIHVTDDGTQTGVPVEGATFYRCDADGNTYGDVITTDTEGNAIFNNVPYAQEDAPIIYYKQTSSDGEHTFDDSLQNTTITESTAVIELQNAEATERNITLTDANYSGLPIADATITLS